MHWSTTTFLSCSTVWHTGWKLIFFGTFSLFSLFLWSFNNFTYLILLLNFWELQEIRLGQTIRKLITCTILAVGQYFSRLSYFKSINIACDTINLPTNESQKPQHSFPQNVHLFAFADWLILTLIYASILVRLRTKVVWEKRCTAPARPAVLLTGPDLSFMGFLVCTCAHTRNPFWNPVKRLHS